MAFTEDPSIEDLPTGDQLALRNTLAFEAQADALKLNAKHMGEYVSMASVVHAPLLNDPRVDRFERLLHSAVQGQAGSGVKNLLAVAKELCDGVDAYAASLPPPQPAPTQQANVAPTGTPNG